MFDFLNLQKIRPPVSRRFFEKVKNAALGKRYDLSLVLLSDRAARRLNKKYRGGNYSPNVLSFSLAKNCGEIFLNPTQARDEARRQNQSSRRRLLILFIHGLLHLKGLRHGRPMEAAEEKLAGLVFLADRRRPRRK